MRRLVFFMQVSLDGFMEGPNREIDWHLVDDELHQHFNDELRGMSAFHQGRVTHELMAAYWPTADQDPAADATTKDFAGIWRDMPKYVYSSTYDRTDWNTTIRRAVDRDEINRLKQLEGGDMVVGGADLARSMGDLIDEYRVYVHPVLVGAGKPALGGIRRNLTLTETKKFGNGVVLLRYSSDR